MSDKLSGTLKKGECIIGSGIVDPPYPIYVNFGTRINKKAQPFLSTSYEVVKAKAAGTFKKGMTEEIYKGLSNKYRQVISGEAEFIGTELDNAFDEGIEISLEVLAAAGVSTAKALCPTITNRLQNSIMWKSSKKQGGFGV